MSRMHVLGLVKQKGGAGATTIAVHLALAAQAAGRRVVIVDVDPQRSALAWWSARTTALGADSEPPVVAVEPDRLGEVLAAAAADGYDLAIIDTPPHNSPVLGAVARASDYCLLPTKPGPFDLAALGPAVEVVRAVGRPAAVVLTMIPATGTEGEEAREAAATYGLPVWEGQLGDRRAYRRTVAVGRTVIDPADARDRSSARVASDEVRALWDHVDAALAGAPARTRPAARRRAGPAAGTTSRPVD